MALVPAGFLVLLLLGALAVDDGAAYLGQRDLSASVQAAANDAAGAAVSDAAFYGQGTIQLDPERAGQIVCRDLAAAGSDRLQDKTASLAVMGHAVYVEAHAEVGAVFGRTIPGLARRPVSATAGAVATADPGSQRPPPPPPGAYTPLAC